MKNKKMKTNEIITREIIKNLEKAGTWVKTWESLHNINHVSQKAYRGINVLLLAQSREKNDFNSNVWLTFNQAQKAGGQILKGSKSTRVIFYKVIDVNKDDDNKSRKTIPFLRYYNLFNLNQTKGIEDKQERNDNKEKQEPQEIADAYLSREEIEVKARGRASYSKIDDTINMPELGSFVTSDDYYKTMFHEMTHSTGAEHRLNRSLEALSHNSKEYSKEELTAELGSLFLGNKADLNLRLDNSKAYIKNWVKALKDDAQMIISASSKAQKAVDYILTG